MNGANIVQNIARRVKITVQYWIYNNREKRMCAHVCVPHKITTVCSLKLAIPCRKDVDFTFRGYS